MFSDLFQITLIAATLASALVAGVFLTFSDFVMRSLARARPAAGIEAMQIINREVYRSQFMVLLIGMAIAAITLAAVGLVLASGPVVLWLLAGAAAYLGGVMAVTARANVPMNQRLDSQDPHSASARTLWQTYQRNWTRWNHLRSAAAAIAALCYLAAALALNVSA
ncbi:anthrone oxygenase family protein [Marimonas lutisalis]|uniref:anthrone oxygenase family protein n=1 Tax=Marimonas lutisalis TaxID=2545756 RepID=UPI0010F58A28|nr:anthrone oxygenase family protein [Marimonas lutisalis]